MDRPFRTSAWNLAPILFIDPVSVEILFPNQLILRRFGLGLTQHAEEHGQTQ